MRTRLLIALAVCATPLAAQNVPSLLNYQGYLTGATGSPLTNGNYNLSFSIFAAPCGANPCGDTAVWGPQVIPATLSGGYFNVVLSTDATARPISGAFGTANRYVEVKVNGAPPILPRQQILTAPFAFRSDTAGTATNLADGMVTAVPPSEVDFNLESATEDLALGISGTAWSEGLQIRSVSGESNHPLRLEAAKFALMGGSVGISTTVPQAPLHVAGDARVDGQVRVGSQKFCYLVQQNGLYAFSQQVPSAWTPQNCATHATFMASSLNAGGFFYYLGCLFGTGSASVGSANSQVPPAPNCGW